MTADEVRVLVSSIYGAHTRQGLVKVDWGDTLHELITPAEARRVAGLLLECAEAAEIDAIVVEFFMSRMNLPIEQAALVLDDFRKLRGET